MQRIKFQNSQADAPGAASPQITADRILSFSFMHFEFVKGDIVKFANEANVCPDYLHNLENIYQIVSMEGSSVRLSRSFSPIIEADLSTITAVKMDGQEDKYIYYDPVIAAPTVWPGDPVPVHRKNYTYYLDAIITFPHDRTMQDFIKENSFVFVHELQHYLRKHYHSDDLKINI